MTRSISRRHFLMSAAGTVAAAGLRAQPRVAANDKLHVAVIGVAGQGVYNWSQLKTIPQCEVVALCDVHETRIGPAREAFPKATFDVDFRKTLERKGIDAVLIATPDHTHAHPTLMALRTGRHVYCEKPLTHTIEEARLVTETAKREKRVTQMGTQIHAEKNYRRVVELIKAGAIGPVSEVHVWVGTSYSTPGRPAGSEPVLPGLHWDLWLGPAPARPFHHGAAPDQFGTYLPFNWRRWWDFGGGAMTDMACHYVDLPYWALDLKYPVRVEARGPQPHPESAAPWLIVEYLFPSRGEQPPVKLTWYDGGKKPDYIVRNKLNWGAGVLFVGTEGRMLLSDYGRHVLLPEKQFVDFKRPPQSIPDSIGHHREWVEACIKGEPTTTCDFSYSGPLAETAMLGVVAFRTGKALEWDAAHLKATNAPEADRYIRKEYRKGWELV